MPKIVVEGPDGRKFAFPDTMPRAQINEFMRTKYGTKARDESVQDYLARFGREQAATEDRAKDIDREATAVGRAEGERAAERMGVDNPFLMAFAAPAIGLAQQEGGRRVLHKLTQRGRLLLQAAVECLAQGKPEIVGAFAGMELHQFDRYLVETVVF
jgi:hypothetical protein